jgi:hypothetical protein
MQSGKADAPNTQLSEADALNKRVIELYRAGNLEPVPPRRADTSDRRNAWEAPVPFDRSGNSQNGPARALVQFHMIGDFSASALSLPRLHVAEHIGLIAIAPRRGDAHAC